jgi:hypothetical protein
MASRDSPEDLKRAFLSGLAPCFCGSDTCLVGAQRAVLDQAFQFYCTAYSSGDCSTSEEHPHAFSQLWAFATPLNSVSGRQSTLSQWRRDRGVSTVPAASTPLARFVQGYLEQFPTESFTITLAEQVPGAGASGRAINVAVSLTARRRRDPSGLRRRAGAGASASASGARAGRALSAAELDFVAKRRRLAAASAAAAAAAHAASSAVATRHMEDSFKKVSLIDDAGFGSPGIARCQRLREAARRTLAAHAAETHFRCTAGVVLTAGAAGALPDVAVAVDTAAIVAAAQRTFADVDFNFKHPVHGPDRHRQAAYGLSCDTPRLQARPVCAGVDDVAARHAAERLPLCGRGDCRAGECLYRRLDPFGARRAVAALRVFMGAGADEAVTATLRVERLGPCASQASVRLRAALRTLAFDGLLDGGAARVGGGVGQ